MKKLVLLLLVIFIFTGCTLIRPGYVGIKVYLTGSKRGTMEVKEPGRYGTGINVNWYKFPTFKQNYVWTKDPKESSPDDESFNFPVDGMVVGLDVGIEYSLMKDKVANIFESYRKGVEELTDITIRNAVRDAINREAANYSMDMLVENGADELLKKAEKIACGYFSEKGIVIHSLSLVTAPRYPESVVRAITAKIEATQRAVQKENELREAKAEAEKKKAEAEGNAAAMVEMAKAEAESNKLKSNSITTNIIKLEWIKKWNGELPEVTSNSDFIIDMK